MYPDDILPTYSVSIVLLISWSRYSIAIVTTVEIEVTLFQDLENSMQIKVHTAQLRIKINIIFIEGQFYQKKITGTSRVAAKLNAA